MKLNPVNVAIFNDTNTDTSNHYGCSLVMYNLVQKLKEHNLNPVFFWPVGVDWRNHKNLIKNNFNFSAIIVNGEGTIHHNNEKEKANYTVEIAEFANKELKIPVFLINTTLYENTPDLYEKIRYFNKAFVRESSTQSILQKHGIESEIVPDLTFATSLKVDKELKTDDTYLITDSTFNDLRGYLKNVGDSIGWEYVSMKANRESSLISKYFRKFQKLAKYKKFKRVRKLFSYPIKAEESFKKRMKGLKKPYSEEYSRIVDHNWFIEKIKSKSFVLTGRFHTITLCIKTETPFIALESNTPKISALLNDVFGSDSRLVTKNDLEKFSGEIPKEYLMYSDKEIEAIRKFNSRATTKIDEMIKSIAKSINDNI